MRRVVSAILRLMGWRLVGEVPDVDRCLVIFAPHTSNWDFPILLLVRYAFDRRVHYLGKHTLFRPPFGWLFRALDGIPVDREYRHRLVDNVVQEFERRDRFWLALSPEGTRAKTDHWKSGFYYIALGAKVPILLTFIDSSTRRCGLGSLVELSGDQERDMALLRAFYQDKVGIHPERASDIRLREDASARRQV